MKGEAQRIPAQAIAVAAEVLAQHYSHTHLNTIFGERGAPGDPPLGNKVEKCRAWFQRANIDSNADAFALLGGVLEEFMERDIDDLDETRATDWRAARDRVRASLGRAGLSYHPGGQILGAASGAPTKSLEAILRGSDLKAVDVEFQRAIDAVERDPPAAVTAASSIIESFCKVYIQDEKLDSPTKQDVKNLWQVVRDDLKLDPRVVEDQDIKAILAGLAALVNGIGALRTHAGSAHGQGRRPYRLEARHARLAIHAAHTLVGFLIETWSVRRGRRP